MVVVMVRGQERVVLMLLRVVQAVNVLLVLVLVLMVAVRPARRRGIVVGRGMSVRGGGEIRR